MTDRIGYRAPFGYHTVDSRRSVDSSMYSSNAGSALTALQLAVALPDAFSPQEYVRALRRNHDDVTKAAVQLKAKHAWLTANQFDNLSLAKPSVQREVKKQYLQVLHDATDKCKCPIVLFSAAKFHPTQSTDKLVTGNELCTDHGGVSRSDETSSTIDDARRLIVYMVTLAVELMDDANAPGIVYLIDMDGVSSNVVTEGSVHVELLRMLKAYFCDTVQFCFVVNFSANAWIQQATAYVLKTTLGVSDRTQPKIKFIADVRELHPYFHAPSLPQAFGGSYKLMPAAAWMDIQADLEDLDLDNLPADDEETAYMVQLTNPADMNSTVLRGPLWRNKSGISWVKTYAVLRPDALLLYEHIKGTMPMVIIPVNHDVAVTVSQVEPSFSGVFGFRVDVEGVPGGHLLAAASEKERGNWLQDIQMGIQAFQELHAREVYEEERKLRMDDEFRKLNMIDFSTDVVYVLLVLVALAPDY
ncbi:hypothetical protein DYB25_003277 [Aphanomyces astaci]|uniref:CRAL-TRIO domain-containing protein n=2 Tax=Aphanomyces astaci TaxID=112090 RepID=A0A397B5T4_APHAT|nr:hypothetical protein DYB36_005628 [Aphanomyces astaci]RHY27778.1 hypothetical protein DYB25_003277 [Aphanomyces astaci]